MLKPSLSVSEEARGTEGVNLGKARRKGARATSDLANAKAPIASTQSPIFGHKKNVDLPRR